MNSVLDTCTMIAYLRAEPGGSVVASLLDDPSSSAFAHSVNLCEVYYQFLRSCDEATANDAIRALDEIGVIERSDLDRPFWQRVGRHKSRGRIALANCFCLALAEVLSGQIITSDHGEFDPIVPLGSCPILFIR